MKRLDENLFLVKNFNKFNKLQKKQIQKNLDKEQCKFIIELLGNIVNSNLVIDSKTKEKLKKYRKKINFLLSKKSLRKKKPILVNGGLVPAIFASLIPFALEQLVKYVKKKE